MRVLIIGNGAREHALAWKFAASKRIDGLHMVPGNGGTASIGVNHPELSASDQAGVAKLCAAENIDLVFVGPEDPLTDGIVDFLEGQGIRTIGPHREAAKLEGSKTFSKDFMNRHKVPTARAVKVTKIKALEKEIKAEKGIRVIKKNGLAAGKGVLESEDPAELLTFGKAILDGGDELLIEEFLTGYEISVFTLSDGEHYEVLPECADFKKAHDGDEGPNTGGMGAICPVPAVTESLRREIREKVLDPTFAGLAADGLAYKGVLYTGLMITDHGPKVLEYNVRFGDPEAQVLLPLIRSDFCNLAEALATGTLGRFPLDVEDRFSLGVVVAAEGYPGSYEKGRVVEPVPRVSDREGAIFHASTTLDNTGSVKTGGGRCFTAVGLGDSFLDARAAAYRLARTIRFPGAWSRSDIGAKFFLEEA